MGRTVVEARIQNLGDLYNVREGRMNPGERGHWKFPTLVDTGATMLSLPPRLIKQLGLKKFTTRRMRTAKRTAEFDIFDAVRLTIQGRECTIDVAAVAKGCPVLIGQVPLEMLDFLVDPKGQRLIGNPEHGGKFMHDLY